MKTREDFKSFDEFYSSIANQKGVTEYISEVILSRYNKESSLKTNISIIFHLIFGIS